MEHGTYIVQNVCNLDQIGAVRCTTVGTFPAVQGASGSRCLGLNWCFLFRVNRSYIWMQEIMGTTYH